MPAMSQDAGAEAQGFRLEKRPLCRRFF